MSTAQRETPSQYIILLNFDCILNIYKLAYAQQRSV